MALLVPQNYLEATEIVFQIDLDTVNVFFLSLSYPKSLLRNGLKLLNVKYLCWSFQTWPLWNSPPLLLLRWGSAWNPSAHDRTKAHANLIAIFKQKIIRDKLNWTIIKPMFVLKHAVPQPRCMLAKHPSSAPATLSGSPPEWLFATGGCKITVQKGWTLQSSEHANNKGSILSLLHYQQKVSKPGVLRLVMQHRKQNLYAFRVQDP